MKSQWIVLAIAGLIIGIFSGLVYGWLVDPVQYVDTSPNSLRIDYQTDIVLMAATIYSQEHDIQLASERLSLFGGSDLGSLLRECLDYAERMHFSTQDITYIKLLIEAVSKSRLQGENQP